MKLPQNYVLRIGHSDRMNHLQYSIFQIKFNHSNAAFITQDNQSGIL